MKNFAATIMLILGAYATHQKPYSAGEIHSTEVYLYGRFVASMKSSNYKGTASAFYLYNLEDGEEEDFWEEWNSIAVFPSHEPGLFSQMSVDMLGGDWQPHNNTGFNLDDDEYHKFEIEWTPYYISYRVDGNEIRHRTNGRDLEIPQNLVMSIFQPGADEIDPYYLPTSTLVDYVEVYHYNSEEGTFWLSYRDDFTYLDSGRWAKGDNTSWKGNNSTFEEKNVFAEPFVDTGRLFLTLDVNEKFKPSDDGCPDKTGEEPNFHVLPAPQNGTLDAAIEKATRAAVTMVRIQLENFSNYLLPPL